MRVFVWYVNKIEFNKFLINPNSKQFNSFQQLQAKTDELDVKNTSNNAASNGVVGEDGKNADEEQLRHLLHQVQYPFIEGEKNHAFTGPYRD